jgi:hypothetical protein
MFADSFLTLTGVAADAATLIASLIVLGVTILGWTLGSRWIQSITGGVDGRENYYRDEFESEGEDDGDWHQFMDARDEEDLH